MRKGLKTKKSQKKTSAAWEGSYFLNLPQTTLRLCGSGGGNND